ncbi:MAG: hypothetical protein JWN22_1118, partial [Nocardioides sp.]|nr:hypothetical protein [Nocardioides sp.]
MDAPRTDRPRPARHLPWAAALLALVLALALTAAGCSADGTSATGATGATPAPTTTPTTRPSGTPTPDATSRYPTYVALGDSYTAAPLVPDTDT